MEVKALALHVTDQGLNLQHHIGISSEYKMERLLEH